MPQNIYDDEAFFAQYAQLACSRNGLAAAPEWPALRAMLPPLAGRVVVDIGCGYGWFCRFAAQQGAARVIGLDVSERMLAQARATTADDRIEYVRADAEQLNLGDLRVDAAYSSLTLHYVPDLDVVLRELRRVMNVGGTFVCSVEHPIYTAPAHPSFARGADGRAVWPLDRYADEGERVTDWLADGVVKFHRTVASYIMGLHRNGFQLRDLVDWSPSAADVAEHPDWADDVQRPSFMLFSASAV